MTAQRDWPGRWLAAGGKGRPGPPPGGENDPSDPGRRGRGGGRGGRGGRGGPGGPGSGGPEDFEGGGGGPGFGWGPPWGAGFGGGRHPGFFPGGRGFGPRGFGRGHRARRGDVRAALLALLAEEPRHGYQLIQELAERSGGVWQPSPGSVYPTLQLLEDEGLVRVEEIDGRRVFHLTDAGRAEVEARTGPAPWEQLGDAGDGSAMALRGMLMQVAAAVQQVAMAGTEAQQTEALKLLSDLRRSLYRILAGDEPAG